MVAITITRPQLQALQARVDEVNDANARGYSVERVESVLVTPAGLDAVNAALLTADGDNVETLFVTPDGRITLD